MSRILYDGWPLIHAPLSPGAWHLRTLVALAPGGVEAMLAVPSSMPAEPVQAPAAVYEYCGERRTWEQRVLPRLAQEQRAAAIHTSGLGVALFGDPALVSPAEAGGHGERGRLGAALGRGGLARACLLWPQGLPEPELPGQLLRLPQVVHPDFAPGSGIAVRNASLPEEYILVHGLGSPAALLRLLEAWSWAAASIGEFYPLVIVEDDVELLKALDKLLPEFHLGETVQVIQQLPAQELPELYRAALAVVQAGEVTAWGSSLAQALASGRAVVAAESPLAAALAGPAAYLVEAADARSFGAAIITVVVDEAAREKLEQAAVQRSRGWEAGAFRKALGETYAQIGG